MQMKEFDVSPDEGIISSTEEFGKYGPYMQSKREEIYKTCAKHLTTKGLAYPLCFCTPEQLELKIILKKKINKEQDIIQVLLDETDSADEAQNKS